ncbi:hypothetical protein ABVV53_16775 [Novosphingobium sp. RD2P27]|uniref:Uncharacterized protein n=1 Tax=Novosphingobium kalidii TaxID=3230299 RepID=A0ABV2D5E6_9SPHN
MKMLRALPLLLALSACGSQESEAPAKGSSFGEVLPGSVSDAMLPYNTASSAPPLEAGEGASFSAPEKAAGDARPAPPEATDASEPEPDAT